MSTMKLTRVRICNDFRRLAGTHASGVLHARRVRTGASVRELHVYLMRNNAPLVPFIE